MYYIIVLKINEFQFPWLWKPPSRFSLSVERCLHEHQNNWSSQVWSHGKSWKLQQVVSWLSVQSLLHASRCQWGLLRSEWLHFVGERSKVNCNYYVNDLLPMIVEICSYNPPSWRMASSANIAYNTETSLTWMFSAISVHLVLLFCHVRPRPTFTDHCYATLLALMLGYGHMYWCLTGSYHYCYTRWPAVVSSRWLSCPQGSWQLLFWLCSADRIWQSSTQQPQSTTASTVHVTWLICRHFIVLLLAELTVVCVCVNKRIHSEVAVICVHIMYSCTCTHTHYYWAAPKWIQLQKRQNYKKR